MLRSLLVVSLLAGVAHADGEAEKLYQEGQAAYDAKRYDDAIKAWDQSYALSRLPALVFNLAQAHRLGGHCAKAVAAYKRFLSLDPASELRPDAEGFLKELEPCADVAPKPEKPKLVETYKIEDRGGGMRRAGLIAGGSGLAVFVAGLYFGSRATSLANEVQEACAMGCEWATVEDKDASGRKAQTLQYSFYALGGFALVAGTALYFLGNKRRETKVLTWVPTGGDGAGVSVGGRF